MNNRTQSIVAILVTLFLGATGYSSLNNLAGVNQLQQKVAELSASISHQTTPVITANGVTSTESNEQVNVGGAITTTTPFTTEYQTNTSGLRFTNLEPLLLFWDTPVVSVTLFFSPTMPMTEAHIQLLIAQDGLGNALNNGYRSEEAQISSRTTPTQTIGLRFESVPPTGVYLARLVAANHDILATQSTKLVVANQTSIALHQKLASIINNKQIVIAGGRWWPLLFLCPQKNLCEYSWNDYVLLLPPNYLDTERYSLTVSELADSTNGRSAHLRSIGESQSLPLSDTQPISLTLKPLDIKYPGTYTGTFTITDLDNGSMEIIPIIVHARVYSWAALVVIFLTSLVAGLAIFDPLNQHKQTLFVTSVFIATMTGISYIESRLPTFGNLTDYYAALGWAFGGGIAGTSALAVILYLVKPPDNSAASTKSSGGLGALAVFVSVVMIIIMSVVAKVALEIAKENHTEYWVIGSGVLIIAGIVVAIATAMVVAKQTKETKPFLKKVQSVIMTKMAGWSVRIAIAAVITAALGAVIWASSLEKVWADVVAFLAVLGLVIVTMMLVLVQRWDSKKLFEKVKSELSDGP